MSEHSYTVRSIASNGGLVIKYRADCPCGTVFSLHLDEKEAGLDGLDHVRTMSGRKTRREEIAEELEAKKAAAKAKRLT